jgi:hypothetical protein
LSTRRRRKPGLVAEAELPPMPVARARCAGFTAEHRAAGERRRGDG